MKKAVIVKEGPIEVVKVVDVCSPKDCKKGVRKEEERWKHGKGAFTGTHLMRHR